MHVDPIQNEIEAKGLTAPRVTPADIEAEIASEHYFTAADGASGALVAQLRAFDPTKAVSHAPLSEDPAAPSPLSCLTFCVLVLRNGFTVTGESACASPENFNEEIGRKIARQNAEQKIWPLMGYHLKQTLHEKANAPVSDFLGRLRAEHHELNERLGKLEKFIGSPAYMALPGIDQADLRTQAEQMREYSTTLSRRLGRLS